MARTLTIIGPAFLLAATIFAVSLLPVGQRSLGPIENIHGIPYPKTGDTILITEKLAHADIFLQEPVLAKNLILEIDFRPINLTSLSVGTREDSFWLSYSNKQKVFSAEIPNSKFQIQNSTLTIPLTDKFQESDRSLDLMFFAEAPPGQEPLWELRNLQAKVAYAMPSYAQFRNYIGSIVKRERAL